jgi:hypothetical protein
MEQLEKRAFKDNLLLKIVMDRINSQDAFLLIGFGWSRIAYTVVPLSLRHFVFPRGLLKS